MVQTLYTQDPYDYETGMRRAAEDGNIGFVQMMLDKGATNFNETFGAAALHGHRQIMELMLNPYQLEGEELNRYQRATDYKFALINAAEGGHREIIEWIFTLRDRTHQLENNEIMKYASYGGNIEIVEWMLSLGAKDYQKCVEWAAYGGHLEIVNLFLGLEVDNYDNIFAAAAEGGYVEIMRLMLSKGVNKFGKALRNAAGGGHLEIVKWILELGGNSFKADDDYWWAVLEAAGARNLDIIKLLMKFSAIDIEKGTVLHMNVFKEIIYRAISGRKNNVLSEKSYWYSYHLYRNYETIDQTPESKIKEIVLFSLKEGSDYLKSWSDSLGNSLSKAAKAGYNEIILMLISHITDGKPNYRAVLRSAVDGGHIETVKLLLFAMNVSHNIEPEDYKHSLSNAIEGGHTELSKFLFNLIFEHGYKFNYEYVIRKAIGMGNIEFVKAFLNTSNYDLSTLLNIAVNEGKLEVVELLLPFINNWNDYKMLYRVAKYQGYWKIVQLVKDKIPLELQNVPLIDLL